MTFSFIHTADWQIGKPFRNFPERLAGRLVEARLGAIDRLAAAALKRGIRHVLVAGDVWDGDRLDLREVRQPLARMGKYPGLTWVLIPGNHDAARVGSVWSRLADIGAPPNVVALAEPRLVEIVPGVHVLPAPLTSRRPGSDPTLWMNEAASAAGTVRIGLAHGSVQTFGSDDAGGGIIDPARAKLAGLDYLALGDWHGATEINARTWYSGTPEPDRFKDNEPGEALAVTIAGSGATPAVERIATAEFVWIEAAVELAGTRDLERIEERIRERGVALDRILLRLKMTGRLPLTDLYGIESWRERIAAELPYLECDMEGIGVASTDRDMELFGASGELRMAADELMALTRAGGDMAGDGIAASAAHDASEALRQLLTIVAEVRDGTGIRTQAGNLKEGGR